MFGTNIYGDMIYAVTDLECKTVCLVSICIYTACPAKFYFLYLWSDSGFCSNIINVNESRLEVVS